MKSYYRINIVVSKDYKEFFFATDSEELAKLFTQQLNEMEESLLDFSKKISDFADSWNKKNPEPKLHNSVNSRASKKHLNQLKERGNAPLACDKESYYKLIQERKDSFQKEVWDSVNNYNFYKVDNRIKHLIDFEEKLKLIFLRAMYGCFYYKKVYEYQQMEVIKSDE